MAVYLIGFAICLGIVAYAQKKRLSVFLIFSALALLIPCLIAGLRNQHVGTDVMVYVKPLTSSAITSQNLKEFFNCYWFQEWRNLYAVDYDIGFSLVVYFVAKLTHSLPAVLFSIQALMVVPVYIALARNRDKMPIWIGMAIYLLLFFNSTLNMMRQWIAMAFLLLAFQMLLEKRSFWVGILTFVAFLFHSTAVVAIPVYLIYWLLWVPRKHCLQQGNLQVGIPTVLSVLIFFVSILAILNLPLVIKLVSMVGFSQFNNYLQGGQISLMVGQIILRLPLFLLLILCWKDMKARWTMVPFFLTMLFLDLVAAHLVSVDVNTLRISHYFSLYSLLWVPAAIGSCPSKGKRVLLTVMIICYGLFYWYYTYVMQMRHETYPYQFYF